MIDAVLNQSPAAIAGLHPVQYSDGRYRRLIMILGDSAPRDCSTSLWAPPYKLWSGGDQYCCYKLALEEQRAKLTPPQLGRYHNRSATISDACRRPLVLGKNRPDNSTAVSLEIRRLPATLLRANALRNNGSAPQILPLVWNDNGAVDLRCTASFGIRRRRCEWGNSVWK